MATSTVVSSLPTTSPNPSVINTGLPIIGSIDLSNPLDLIFIGGVVLSVLVAPGYWKIIVPAGLLGIRYEMGKASF